jgi:hypothetical protein
MTGFLVLEPILGTKLLDLLKEITPQVARISIVSKPDNPGNQRVRGAIARPPNLEPPPHSAANTHCRRQDCRTFFRKSLTFSTALLRAAAL